MTNYLGFYCGHSRGQQLGHILSEQSYREEQLVKHDKQLEEEARLVIRPHSLSYRPAYYDGAGELHRPGLQVKGRILGAVTKEDVIRFSDRAIPDYQVQMELSNRQMQRLIKAGLFDTNQSSFRSLLEKVDETTIATFTVPGKVQFSTYQCYDPLMSTTCYLAVGGVNAYDVWLPVTSETQNSFNQYMDQLWLSKEMIQAVALSEEKESVHVQKTEQESADLTSVSDTDKTLQADEATKIPLVDETSKKPLTDETSKGSSVDETVKTPLADETSKKLLTDEMSKASSVDETVKTPLVDETNKTLQADKTSKEPEADDFDTKDLMKAFDQALSDDAGSKDDLSDDIFDYFFDDLSLNGRDDDYGLDR